MDTQPFCVFQCKETQSRVLLFTEEKLKMCQEKLKIRVLCKLKYNDIILPKEPTDTHGYHSSCYKTFTSVQKKYCEIYEKQVLEKSTGSSVLEASSSLGQSDSGCGTSNVDEPVLSPIEESEVNTSTVNVCLFCNHERKKVNYALVPIHVCNDKKLFDDILVNATALQDNEVIEKLGSVKPNEKIFYHNVCKLAYLKKHINAPTSSHSEWHDKRLIHEVAFNTICEYIKENVIVKKHCCLLQFLTDMYKEVLEKKCAELNTSFNSIFTPQHLLEKLQSFYGDDIQVITMHKKKVIGPKSDCIIDDDIFSQMQEYEALQRNAFFLRKKILSIPKKRLPEHVKVTDLIQGECDIPDEVIDFFKTLLCGIDSRRQMSQHCLCRVKSLAQDVIYAVHHGKIKTSKHITLGMTLKSITSSRKVIDLVNKFGHCCSYSAIEELETEVTFYSSVSNRICPENAILSPNLCTGIAFDNYDRFVETCSGKDTLHDTVGIFYQNVSDIVDAPRDIDIDIDINIDEDLSSSHVKRRRTLDPIAPEMPAYNKRPKLLECLLPTDSELRQVTATNLDSYIKVDICWILSHYLKIGKTPMWVGYNSKITEDNSVKQKVSYLTPINASPTDKSVIYETMRQAQQIATECSQNYMQITYDLAIAKIAYQIQSEEKPLFDNLFIHMGGFHVMMAYFKAIGKYIDECGLTHIMVESGLLASGSINGFITGKHFNRCKRLHPMIALGLQMLHIEEFFNRQCITVQDSLRNKLAIFESETLPNSNLFEDIELAEIMEKYLKFKKDTENGKHGKTAQFYIMYVNFINYYLMFTRSIRNGDFELYKYVIPKLCNLFFIFNQINYSRWLLKYHDNLLKVNETHPQLAAEFKKGIFGIKRTDKPFSRSPIDLTLEQTINADASRRLTGVTHFTNSISARQRWSKSHSIRSTITTYTFDEIGLKRAQDVTSDLEKHQIDKDNKQLSAFVEEIKKNINPFNVPSGTDNNLLYNITTGRSASQPLADFLLNVEKEGDRLRTIFITECAESQERFEKTIKLNKIINFANSTEKKKVRVNNKVQEVRLQRDLFGRMLGISMDENSDIEKILSYPITPVPTSLCNLDGTICKTNKSVLQNLLKSDSSSIYPSRIDVLIIDGFFLMHCMKEVPTTFGRIATKFLQMVTNNQASEVHVIFDRYFCPSIKDYERSIRAKSVSDRDYIISGPEQTRPVDFFKELRNNKFKEALINFLILHWQSNEMAIFIKNKVIMINFDYCYMYKLDDKENVIQTKNYDFSCIAHEEADTKIIYHICAINCDADIVIKCSDTDILIILLGNMHNVKTKSNIWIECGTTSNRSTIDVCKLYNSLGEALCRSLPGFHALTGCDYNPSFYRKGKQRPYSILRSNEQYIKAFTDVGDTSCDEKSVFKILETFVCHMYGITSKRKEITVNQARFNIFLKNYKVKNIHEPFSKKNLKNIDSCSLPPCQAELHQQLLRCKYISNIWQNAYKKVPSSLDPEEFGWITGQNLLYEFKWFDGDQLPPTVKDVLINTDDDEDENIKYDSDETTDTDDSDECQHD